MGGANFGRHVAYWLYCYELLKVGRLMPQVLNRDFSASRDPMLDFQKKKTRQSLQGFNVFMCIAFASVIAIHMASSSLTGVILTYVPQTIQAGILCNALIHIRNSLNQLTEGAQSPFVPNERPMYIQAILSILAIVSGISANLLTVKSKTIELDNDSIGSQERYYNAWTTPVYIWCFHYVTVIGFITSVMFVLFKTGSLVDGQID